MNNKRLFKYRIKTEHAKKQIMGFYNSMKQYNVVPSARRSYKTESSKRRLVKRALSAHDKNSPFYVDRAANYLVACPTLTQTIRIYWNDLTDLLKGFIKNRNKSQRTIELVNGSTIFLISGDAPERIEGSLWDGCILDEYGNMDEEVWSAHLAPCLSDTGGYCDFIGVPEGRNHYYKLWLDAKDNPEYWDTWHWVSADVLPDHVIEQYRKMLDEKTFRQEMCGSFESYQGLAYHQWNRDQHIQSIDYNPKNPLFIQFDFNVSPGVAVFTQECERGQCKTLPDFNGTAAISEVYIGKNSNTELVAGKCIQLFRNHQSTFIVDGDATGGARRTSSDRSDWEIVLLLFKAAFPGRVHFKVPSINPFQRDRVNAVNSRLKNINNEISLIVDKDRCPRLIEDFENTTINDKGEIDKSVSKFSHLTDALGYYISRQYPVVQYTNPTMTHWK